MKCLAVFAVSLVLCSETAVGAQSSFAVDVRYALEKSLTPSDLKSSKAKFDARILELGRARKSVAWDRLGGSQRVRDALDWWVVIVVPKDDTALEFLVRPGGPRSKVIVSPIPKPSDEGGPVDGEWKKVGNFLVGAGVLTQSSNHPPAGIQLLSVRDDSVKSIQSFVTEDECAGEVRMGKGFWDRSQDIIVATRLDDFRALFGAPQAGPWLTHRTRWRLRQGRLHLVASHVVENPLSQLDRIAKAVMDSDKITLHRLIANSRLRKQAIQTLKGALSRGRGVPEMTGDQDEFTGRSILLRRPEEQAAFEPRFTFAPRHGKWRLSSIARRGSTKRLSVGVRYVGERKRREDVR